MPKQANAYLPLVLLLLTQNDSNVVTAVAPKNLVCVFLHTRNHPLAFAQGRALASIHLPMILLFKRNMLPAPCPVFTVART